MKRRAFFKTTLAQMLDHGEQLQANVLVLAPGNSPWQGWEIEIEVLA